jgi:ribosome-associated protein
MILVTPELVVDENQINWKFIRASGPGGQHINKSSTAVQLRFSLDTLPEAVSDRLRANHPGRITEAGEIMIEASQHRSQRRNREEALERLLVMIRNAAREPKSRKPTRPSKASRERRISNKRRQSARKKDRQPPELED